MKLYIVRHGEAGAASGGAERALTPTGHQQAQRAGQLLQAERPQLLLFSPKLRARQTAEELQSICTGIPATATDSLLPGATTSDVVSSLEEAQAAGNERVILASHLPLVAELTAWLLTGDSKDYALPGYPPASVVALQLDLVGPAAAQLLWYAFSPDFEKRTH